MPFFFENFPQVEYDLKKNDKLEILTNVTVRFKIQEILQNRTVVLYDYNVKDGERPDVIAYKYYDDPSLDWIILLTNNIVDPLFEWPLDSRSLNRFIIEKYGSIGTAKSTVHEYRQIVREQSTRFDGTFIQEKQLVVDLDTYNTLSPDQRTLVTKYDFEVDLNEQKAQIKILDEKFLASIVSQAEIVFS